MNVFKKYQVNNLYNNNKSTNLFCCWSNYHNACHSKPARLEWAVCLACGNPGWSLPKLSKWPAVIELRRVKTICWTQAEFQPPLLQSIAHLFIQSLLISKIVCPNSTKLDSTLPSALNNTHAKCEADKMNGSWDILSTYRQTARDFWDYWID